MPTLLSLPPELLLSIADHLAPDAVLSLHLTHPTFSRTLPPLPRLRAADLPRCARLAIRAHLAPTPSPHDPDPDPAPSPHRRCALCKALYPAPLFGSASSPACLPPRDAGGRARAAEVVRLPDGVCAWHVGRLTRVVRTGGGAGEEARRNEWVGRVSRMCMHCGVVEGWARCGCGCRSCGWREARTYTRYLDNARECCTFAFWRKGGAGEGEEDGELFVRETCRGDGECVRGEGRGWDGGSRGIPACFTRERGLIAADHTAPTTIINLPVRFEDEGSQRKAE